MARFNITSYGFGELAEAYYPDDDYRTALRLFNKDLHGTRGLWRALQATGFKDYTKVLTRSQVQTIVKYLGEP